MRALPARAMLRPTPANFAPCRAYLEGLDEATLHAHCGVPGIYVRVMRRMLTTQRDTLTSGALRATSTRQTRFTTTTTRDRPIASRCPTARCRRSTVHCADASSSSRFRQTQALRKDGQGDAQFIRSSDRFLAPSKLSHWLAGRHSHHMFLHDRIAIHAGNEHSRPLNVSTNCCFLKAVQHIERAVAADISISPREFELFRHPFPRKLSGKPFERGGSVRRSYVDRQRPKHFGIRFVKRVDAHVLLDVCKQPCRAS